MAGPWTFSPFSTGGDLQRKIKSQKPVDFSCFSLFSDMLFSSPFLNPPDLELGVTRAANKPSGWMAGSITSLLLLRFYIGDVVHCYHDWETGILKISVFCPLFTVLRPPFLFLHLLHNDSRLAAERKGGLVLAGWERELSIYGRLKRGTEKRSLVS